MVDLPCRHRVNAQLKRYPAYFLFPGKFAQPVAHDTELKDAAAFPAMVPLWTVSTGEISLLVVQLFLINLNTCTKSRLWSKAESVACAHSSVVPGWWQPNPRAACPRSSPASHPCPPGVPACPGSLSGAPAAQPEWVVAVGSDPLAGDPRLGTLSCVAGSQHSLSPCAVLSRGWVHIFFPRSYFLMPILQLSLGTRLPARRRREPAMSDATERPL